MDPCYDIKEFIADCSDPNKVYVRGEAVKDALHDFKLDGAVNILDFISRGGLEKLRFFNSEKWDNNPNSTIVMVDAYEFYSGYTFGYMAFHKGPQKWILKSFKKNTFPGFCNFQLRDALENFKLLEKIDEKEKKED